MADMTRKSFLTLLVKTSAVAAAIPLVAACGGGDDDGGGGGGGADAAPGCEETIAGNHGHVLNVTQADIDAGVDKTYILSGSAGHEHELVITAAQFAQLAAGESIMSTSTATTHSHEVTVGGCTA